MHVQEIIIRRYRTPFPLFHFYGWIKRTWVWSDIFKLIIAITWFPFVQSNLIVLRHEMNRIVWWTYKESLHCLGEKKGTWACVEWHIPTPIVMTWFPFAQSKSIRQEISRIVSCTYKKSSLQDTLRTELPHFCFISITDGYALRLVAINIRKECDILALSMSNVRTRAGRIFLYKRNEQQPYLTKESITA